MQENAIKKCKLCYKDLDIRAKRCPYCKHYQSTITTFIHHPAFSIVGVIFSFFLIWYFFSNVLFAKGADYQLHKDKVRIIKSEIKFGDSKCEPTVAVLGEIDNKSGITWKEVQFELTFIDSKGTLLDAEQEKEYSFIVPANRTTPFKISFRREFPDSTYNSHRILIINAKDYRAPF